MENQALASTSVQDTTRAAHKTNAVTRRGKPAHPTGPSEGAPSAGAVLAAPWHGQGSPRVRRGTGARSSAPVDPRLLPAPWRVQRRGLSGLRGTETLQRKQNRH